MIINTTIFPCVLDSKICGAMIGLHGSHGVFGTRRSTKTKSEWLLKMVDLNDDETRLHSARHTLRPDCGLLEILNKTPVWVPRNQHN